jgi:RimJ/RimL family protein N-acetyltransferase
MAGLLARAADAGAHTVYLQVVEANSAARRLYDGLGFAAAYRYWYRMAPP